MKLQDKILNTTVIVSALGYFVDIYDLILFGIVRKPSLEALGVIGDQQKHIGDFLLNSQMIGMLVGGLLWGILGDKKGRLNVLFGSIIMYSIANIANGMVDLFPSNLQIGGYALLRFIAGVGLAGEFGAGVTLVNETMTKENRGWGTSIIAGVGALGAVAAGLIGNYFNDWKLSYFIGGGLGILLLFLRMATFESGMFEKYKNDTQVFKGNLKLIFNNFSNFKKYLACISLALPIWFAIGVIVLLSVEFSKNIGVNPMMKVPTAIVFCYLGLSLGDFLSGAISQWVKSRKYVISAYIIASTIISILICSSHNISDTQFYIYIFLLGLFNGYWVIAVTMSSEQFGTNIRSTVTNTVPNFVRGAVVPITLLFRYFEKETSSGLNAAIYVCLICSVLAMIGIVYLKDTFGKDLDYIEH